MLTPEEYQIFRAFIPNLESVDGSDREDLIRASFANDPELAKKLIELLPYYTTDSDSPLILGKKYQIDEMLAEGGMATVYRGHHVTLDSPVAIKILDPSLARDATYITRFQREARRASSFQNPHIVRIRDFISEKGHFAIIMDFIAGQDMGRLFHEYSKSGPKWPSLPVVVTVLLLEDVCNALQKTHHEGITHRDLKPENILLDDNGYFIVVDFGIAQDIHETGEKLTQPGIPAGTTAYMSPEQAEGKKVSAQSDIFSLGIVAFLFLSGNRPFRGDTQFKVRQSIINDDHPPLDTSVCPDLTPQVKGMVDKMLAKSLDDRYSSIDDLNKDLQKAKNGLKAGGFLPENHRDYLKAFLSAPLEVSNDRRPVSPNPWRRISRPVGIFATLAILAYLAFAWFGDRIGNESTYIKKVPPHYSDVSELDMPIPFNPGFKFNISEAGPLVDASPTPPAPDPKPQKEPEKDSEEEQRSVIDIPQYAYATWTSSTPLTYQLDGGPMQTTFGPDTLTLEPDTQHVLLFFDERSFGKLEFTIGKLITGSYMNLRTINFSSGNLSISSRQNIYDTLIDGQRFTPSKDSFSIASGSHTIQFIKVGYYVRSVYFLDLRSSDDPEEIIPDKSNLGAPVYHFKIDGLRDYALSVVFRKEETFND